MTRAEVRPHLSAFVSLVFAALGKLHGAGYAHLDVRLENICYNDNNKAVLIDLDIAQPLDELVESNHSKSLMYLFNQEYDEGHYLTWQSDL